MHPELTAQSDEAKLIFWDRNQCITTSVCFIYKNTLVWTLDVEGCETKICDQF